MSSVQKIFIADSSNSKRFQQSVVSWFRLNARDLLWRKTSDPYRIWISEVMLQQTQVATVIAYYERFIKRFPDVEALAAANESEVLKLWEGLGYYRRARYLHLGAKMIAETYKGNFPKSKEELLKIPGIGEYSAGAILSIAYRLATPALDGNLIRVYARFFGIRNFVNDPKILKKLWAIATHYSKTSAEDTREFAEGMMEIGALICTPKNPSCRTCPLAWGCIAKKKNLQLLIPRKKNSEKRIKLFERLWFYIRDGRIALLEKGSDPKYPLFYRLPFKNLKTLDRPLKSRDSYRDFKYSITNRDIRVEVVRAKPKMKGIRMMPLSQLSRILLPAIDRRILGKLMAQPANLALPPSRKI